MSAAIIEKRKQRAKNVHDARAIHTRAETEKRDMSAEERKNFDDLMAVVDTLADEIAALKAGEEGEERDEDEDKKKADAERLEAAERAAEEDGKTGERRAPRGTPEQRGGDNREQRYAVAYRNWLRSGIETRDLSLGTNNAGGFLVTPTQMSKDLVVALNNLVFVRGLCDIETLTEAKSLGVPQITTDVSDADWTAEVPTLTADTSLVLARRDLSPNLLCKLVLASHRLLNNSALPEQVIMQRLAYKFAVSEENAFLNGSGSGQPLGLFTASASGIPTSRDVTAASTTTFVGDELINVAMSIPAQYAKSASFGWIMHRDAVKIARKLKDGQGQYLWQIGIGNDRPDTLLGYPLYQSEYAPNTFTTGLYVACLGDMKSYKIADVANMEVQRLVERYADSNQIGFLGRRYLDASPVLSNAFARLKLA